MASTVIWSQVKHICQFQLQKYPMVCAWITFSFWRFWIMRALNLENISSIKDHRVQLKLKVTIISHSISTTIPIMPSFLYIWSYHTTVVFSPAELQNFRIQISVSASVQRKWGHKTDFGPQKYEVSFFWNNHFPISIQKFIHLTLPSLLHGILYISGKSWYVTKTSGYTSCYVANGLYVKIENRKMDSKQKLYFWAKQYVVPFPSDVKHAQQLLKWSRLVTLETKGMGNTPDCYAKSILCYNFVQLHRK